MPDETTTDGRVLTDILTRIDKINEHIIEIKGDIYKRSEWSIDSKRIYDQINEIEAELTKALRDAIGALHNQIEASSSVHSTFALREDCKSCYKRIERLEKNTLPPAIIALIGAIIAAVIIGAIQVWFPVIFSHPQVPTP